MEQKNEQNLIIYNTVDGKASVALYAKDGQVWMNQKQIVELFDTSKSNVSEHISNILKKNSYMLTRLFGNSEQLPKMIKVTNTTLK